MLIQNPPDLGTTMPFPDRAAFFTAPTSQYGDSHMALAADLLQRAVPGSRVWLTLFQFDHESFRDALMAAVDRGVNVHAVLTDRVPDPIYLPLKHAVESRFQEHRVFRWQNGMGSKINHNKFILFSRVEGDAGLVRDVVLQSSANFTHSSLAKHQNTVVLVDRALFKAYLTYWYDLWKHGLAASDDEAYYTSALGDYQDTKVYFFPRESGDTIVNVLDNVRQYKLAQIRIAMARWTGARMAIANKLVWLAGKGCDVRVVTRAPAGDSGVSALVVAALQDSPATLRLLPVDQINLHSKYMLVSAHYVDGDRYSVKRLVWTGSHNFTGAALRKNDEALLKIWDPGVFEAFRSNFEDLWAVATPA